MHLFNMKIIEAFVTLLTLVLLMLLHMSSQFPLLNEYLTARPMSILMILRISFLLVRAECVRQRNEGAIKLGIISLSLSPLSSRRLLKTIEGDVIGF